MSSKEEPTKESTATDKVRARSPAYPALPLGDSIDLARKLWDAQRKQESHIDSVLKTLGYSSRNGRALRVVASLNHYGLIEESGSKDNRKIRLSETAQDIIHLPDSDPRKGAALKTAALQPAIHAALWERYGAHLPDDNSISPFLIRDKGYNDDVVPSLIENYRATFALANLDKIEDPKLDETPDNSKGAGVLSNPTPPKPNPSGGSFVPMTPDSFAQEMPILVGPGKVARVPFPMTEEDFDLFLGTLQLWKKKLIKQPEVKPIEPPTS